MWLSYVPAGQWTPVFQLLTCSFCLQSRSPRFCRTHSSSLFLFIDVPMPSFTCSRKLSSVQKVPAFLLFLNSRTLILSYFVKSILILSSSQHVLVFDILIYLVVCLLSAFPNWNASPQQQSLCWSLSPLVSSMQNDAW